MIRKRDIDFGIWKGIPENKLIIPLDTHIARISRCLGFTKRRSQDWKMAVEITNALKKLDPGDPLKYDFAMCHYGIAGLCSSKDNIKDSRCRKCLLKKEFSSGSRSDLVNDFISRLCYMVFGIKLTLPLS